MELSVLDALPRVRRDFHPKDGEHSDRDKTKLPTKTSTGLAVTVEIFDKVYETGRKVSQAFREEMPIVFDEYLPKWNYRAIPQPAVSTVI